MYNMIGYFGLLKIFALLLIFALLGLLEGCSFVTDADRGLAERTLHDSTGCAYIQGSGGAGVATPMVPLGGGYGQGSISIARSNRDDAKVACGPSGASVE